MHTTGLVTITLPIFMGCSLVQSKPRTKVKDCIVIEGDAGALITCPDGSSVYIERKGNPENGGKQKGVGNKALKEVAPVDSEIIEESEATGEGKVEEVEAVEGSGEVEDSQQGGGDGTGTVVDCYIIQK